MADSTFPTSTSACHAIESLCGFSLQCPLGMLLWKIEGERWTLQSVNPAGWQLLGTAPLALPAPMEALLPEPLVRALRINEGTGATARIGFEVQLPHANGPRHWHVQVQHHATPTADWRVAYLQDVTAERRQALAADGRLQGLELWAEHSPDAVFLLTVRDAERIELAWFNPACAVLLGGHATLLTGILLEEALPADSGQRLAAHCRRCCSRGEPLGFEDEIAAADGTLRYLSTVLAPIREENGRISHLCGMVRDFTHLRQTESELRHSERRFRLLFENMTAGFALHDIICDEAGRPVDYRYRAVNPAFERLTGLKAHSLLGRTVREALPKIEADWIAKFGRVALTGEPLTYENYVEELDRHYATFSFSPQHGQFAVVFHEITEQKKAEAALAASERRYRLLVESLAEGVWQIDPEARTRYVNPRMAQMLGYAREEMLGQPLADFLAEKCRARFAASLERRWQGEERRQEFEFVRKDGAPCFGLLAASAMLSDDNAYEGTLASVLDITEQKQAQEEKADFDRKLLATQKLESLGVLAGGIAHDFNNILSGILGNANLARLQLPPTAGAQSYLDQIEKSAVRAADLCNQMLAYSGRGRFFVQQLDLSLLVKETMQLLQLSISKNAVLKLNLARQLPAISADATQLRQLTMNLVINASEAVGERSGVITLTTGALRADRNYLERTLLANELKEGDYVYLEVSDNGCGMTPETIRRIFDPFFTTKFSGRGLGLSAVLGIVRGHKGGLKVYSEPGVGSTFKVFFPAVAGPVDPLTKRPEAPGDWRGQGTVLVVDDEETVRAVAARALEHFGFNPMLAADGREGLELLRAGGDRIRCVVLDLTMPHMDGEATFRAMRQLRPDLPVLLISGFNEQDAIGRFAGKGLAGFVQKPFNIETFRLKLREILP